MNTFTTERIKKTPACPNKRRRGHDARVETGFHIWRPDDGEDAVMTDLIFAILKTMPRSTKLIPRDSRKYGSTLVGRHNFNNARDTYRGIIPNAHHFVRQNLEEIMPQSANQPLGKVAVKGVVPIGSDRSPTLALLLDSLVLEHEVNSLQEACNELSYRQNYRQPMPHISIAKFEDSYGIPSGVIEAVEEVAPEFFALQKVVITPDWQPLPELNGSTRR